MNDNKVAVGGFIERVADYAFGEGVDQRSGVAVMTIFVVNHIKTFYFQFARACQFVQVLAYTVALAAIVLFRFLCFNEVWKLACSREATDIAACQFPSSCCRLCGRVS